MTCTAITSAWTPGRGVCLEIPFCRFGSLPARHCTWAGGERGGHRWGQASSSHWEWCSGQSWELYCGGWSWDCWGTSCGFDPLWWSWHLSCLVDARPRWGSHPTGWQWKDRKIFWIVLWQSHSEGLCSCPAIQWQCNQPTYVHAYM